MFFSGTNTQQPPPLTMAAVAKKWQDELLDVMPCSDWRTSLTQNDWEKHAVTIVVDNFLMQHQELRWRRRKCRD
jgi:hypothetical protein